MRIRLIQPAQLDEQGGVVQYERLFFPSVTLPTVAALTPADVEVSIENEYVCDVDLDADADLIGITAQTCHAPRAYQLADEFRRRGYKTIMGGIHASVLPEEALQHFDSVLVGEAEGLWPKVVQDTRRGQLQRMYRQETRPDMQELVVPRYDLIDYRHYMVPPMGRTPLLTLQTSRGCPHDCEFCSVSRHFGHSVRKKPVRNVIQEIETVRPSRVFFTDDTLDADPKYARELFSALKPLRLRWACQVSSQIGRFPDLIELAGEAGCHETLVGVESLNKTSLQSVNKAFNLRAQHADTFHRMADVGILPQVSLIFGLDADDQGDLRQMMETIKSWPVNYLYIGVLTPFPGTVLGQSMQEQDRITNRDWSRYDGAHVVYKPRRMGGDELEELVWEAYADFYSRKRIWQRTWCFGRQYATFFPRDNVFEEVFFQYYINRAVRMRRHPFSLGAQRRGMGRDR